MHIREAAKKKSGTKRGGGGKGPATKGKERGKTVFCSRGTKMGGGGGKNLVTQPLK